MAFAEFGDEYLGQWEPFIYDKEKDVQVWLRIRPLTDDENERIEKKYGKYKMNRRQGVRQLQIPAKNTRFVGEARLLFMWTGIRNGYVKLANEATASFFGKCLGKSFKVGEEILLPENVFDRTDPNDEKEPRPMDELKAKMLAQDLRISKKINEVGFGTDDDAVETAEDEKKKANEREEQEAELGKN